MNKPSLEEVDMVHLILDLIAGYRQIALVALHKERKFISSDEAMDEVVIVCEEMLDRIKCHNPTMKV
jgi:hypothetical protein